jgi:hypothetical protein
MPKAEGCQRPLGSPTREDQSVQRATVAGRKAISEQDCRGFSSRCRAGRSPHAGLDTGTGGSAKRHINWGLDGAIWGVVDAIDQVCLGTVVAHRMGDQSIVRPRWRGLQAGVREDGPGRKQEEGTPQRGRRSSWAAHSSRPDALARWAARWQQREAHGGARNGRTAKPPGGSAGTGPCQGAWWRRVLRGHDRDDAVPRHGTRLKGFRETVMRYGCRTRRRRRQRHRMPWQHMDALVERWLPQAPDPASVSRAARARHDPRSEPGAGVPHAGIGAGGVG